MAGLPLGSIAQKVASLADCPVVVVRWLIPRPRPPSNALPLAGLLVEVEAISFLPLKSVFSVRRFTEEGYENTLALCGGVQLAM